MSKLASWGTRGLFFCIMFLPVLFQRWKLNSDVWFILNSGRYVMESGLPHTEPFSMHEGLHFVLEQWLTDIIFWNVFDGFGAEGLLTLTWVTGICLFYAYYRLCLLVGEGNRHVAFGMTFLSGIMVCQAFITTRPQIFSDLCLVIELICLEKYVVSKNWRWLAFLPVISMLLVNLHAALWPMMFILLMPYLAAYLLGRVKPEAFSRDFPTAPILIGGICSFLAGFLNPYGWEAMAFLFYSYDPQIHEHIMEIQSASIKEDYFFFLVTFVLTAMYARNRVPMQHIFLTLGTALLGFWAVRNEFLFFMLGTFPMAGMCRRWKSSLVEENVENKAGFRAFSIFVLNALAIYTIVAKLPQDTVEFPVAISLYFFVTVLCFACFLLGSRVNGRIFDYRVPRLRLKGLIIPVCLILFTGFANWYPEQIKNGYGEEFRPTVDFMLKEDKPSEIVLWNGLNSGAYAEYRGIKAYVDARPEVFAPSNHHGEKNIIKEYFDTISGKLYYGDVFDDYGFTHILVTPSDTAVYLVLAHDPGYHMVFEQKDDKGTVICRLYVPVHSN